MVSEVTRKIDFKPLHDYVLFEDVPDEVTNGGILLPEGATAANMPKGRILAVGPGYRTDNGELVPMDIKVGDIVYMAFAYSKPLIVNLNGKPYGVARSRDLVGMVAN